MLVCCVSQKNLFVCDSVRPWKTSIGARHHCCVVLCLFLVICRAIVITKGYTIIVVIIINESILISNNMVSAIQWQCMSCFATHRLRWFDGCDLYFHLANDGACGVVLSANFCVRLMNVLVAYNIYYFCCHFSWIDPIHTHTHTNTFTYTE